MPAIQNIKVAVDAVVFGYESKKLSVLLIKRGVIDNNTKYISYKKKMVV